MHLRMCYQNRFLCTHISTVPLTINFLPLYYTWFYHLVLIYVSALLYSCYNNLICDLDANETLSALFHMFIFHMAWVRQYFKYFLVAACSYTHTLNALYELLYAQNKVTHIIVWYSRCGWKNQSIWLWLIVKDFHDIIRISLFISTNVAEMLQSPIHHQRIYVWL